MKRENETGHMVQEDDSCILYVRLLIFVMQEVLCRFRLLYILQKATVRSNHHVIFFTRHEN